MRRYEFLNKLAIEYSLDFQQPEVEDDKSKYEFSSSSPFGMYCGTMPPFYLQISQPESETPVKLLKIILIDINPNQLEQDVTMPKVVTVGKFDYNVC